MTEWDCRVPGADCTSASEDALDDGGFPRTACIPRISASMSTPGWSQADLCRNPAGRSAQVQASRLLPAFSHISVYFSSCARTGGGSAGNRNGGPGKVLCLRGTLRGKMAFGGAGRGLPALAPASVLPGQAFCLGCENRSAGHGKEKVYGSIPERPKLKQVFAY